MAKSARDRIIVALDVPTEGQALELVNELLEHVGLFKVGLELLNSVGISIVEKIVERGGVVFLDGKFNDIPNTVAGASRAMARLGVRMFNVHTMGGLSMMRCAVKAAEEESVRLRIERPLILGVTVLTSIDRKALNEELRVPGNVEDHVTHLAALADEAGLDGVIASPHEIDAILRDVRRTMLVVTPGVRPSWAVAHDQKRIMTPSEAILKGASYLVIGRPILRPPAEIGTSVEAAKLVQEEIATALERKEVQRC